MWCTTRLVVYSGLSSSTRSSNSCTSALRVCCFSSLVLHFCSLCFSVVWWRLRSWLRRKFPIFSLKCLKTWTKNMRVFLSSYGVAGVSSSSHRLIVQWSLCNVSDISQGQRRLQLVKDWSSTLFYSSGSYCLFRASSNQGLITSAWLTSVRDT